MLLIGMISGMIVALIVTVCYIVVISFTLWMAIDAGKQDRFWWLTLILGIPVIGPAAYYFTEKKHEYAHAPVHHLHDSETEEQHEVSPKKKKSRKKREEVVEQVGEDKVEGVTEDEVVQSVEPTVSQDEQLAVLGKEEEKPTE